jgi:hypothetical protein
MDDLQQSTRVIEKILLEFVNSLEVNRRIIYYSGTRRGRVAVVGDNCCRGDAAIVDQLRRCIYKLGHVLNPKVFRSPLDFDRDRYDIRAGDVFRRKQVYLVSLQLHVVLHSVAQSLVARGNSEFEACADLHCG